MRKRHRVGGLLFRNYSVLLISQPTCIKHDVLFHTQEPEGERVKSDDEWLEGNMVMQDLAFGHLTASSCKMWHFHISYLCLDRI